MIKTFELIPTKRQKSFYGKAIVIERDNIYLLKSYNTIVAAFDKNTKTFIRCWNGYSNTTAKHVDAFRVSVCGLHAIGKSDWLKIPVMNIEY